jgi:hypothetical protein
VRKNCRTWASDEQIRVLATPCGGAARASSHFTSRTRHVPSKPGGGFCSFLANGGVVGHVGCPVPVLLLKVFFWCADNPLGGSARRPALVAE